MNHGGDLDLAKRMIEAAAKSGANYVKFQTWKIEHLKPGPWDEDGRRELYIQAELEEHDYPILKQCCKDNGVKFLTSCFDERDLQFIRLLTDEVKIPSPEMTDSFVGTASWIFDTVLASTGCCQSDAELKAILSHYKNVVLLHSVPLYPCPYDKVNLIRLARIRKFSWENSHGRPFGYSGHAEGIWDAIGALSLGATYIEKHFTIDKNLPFRDNKFAILPGEMKQIREYADNIELMAIDTFSKEAEEVCQRYAGRWQGP